ncbi:GNAT family N-acetyltransferase [Cellulomonas massiliensis]|uniref:GNAT family N-acetyltransferase n=1 Tax=Cellulomonas massiliensis TaxID=1465811 RepID=UPI0002D76B91|nr:GNAT family N-acetyltransferase [Cellulomonas massiliensis]
MSWTLRELPVPATLDDEDAWLLHGYVRAANAAALDTWGTHDYDVSPAEVLGSLREQTYERKAVVLAVEDEDGDRPDPARVVGSAWLDLPLQDNTHTGYVELVVVPDRRGRGIGSALHERALHVARSAGRSKLTSSTDHRVEPGPDEPSVAPTTGTGRVPPDAPGVGFAQHRGWALEQVERCSQLQLPLDAAELAAHRKDAQGAAGDAYRVVLWRERCPDEWAPAYAVLNQRMSSAVPLGGLDFQEYRWDVARVRAMEQRFLDQRRTILVACAQHVASGELVAKTELVTVAHDDEIVYQWDTLVLDDHRGHRLGMLVKAANLQRLQEEFPRARRVATWNAEENAHMLAINVALGFRPAGCSGAWQIEL